MGILTLYKRLAQKSFIMVKIYFSGRQEAMEQGKSNSF